MKIMKLCNTIIFKEKTFCLYYITSNKQIKRDCTDISTKIFLKNLNNSNSNSNKIFLKQKFHSPTKSLTSYKLKFYHVFLTP